VKDKDNYTLSIILFSHQPKQFWQLPQEVSLELHASPVELGALLIVGEKDSTMVSQIALTLTSIRALLSGLSPSHLLEAERAVRNSGASDPSRLKPAGLTVVIAEKWASLTTTIMPVAAALAAGCPSLVILPLGHQIDDKIWELITKQILYKAIDDGGFGVASYSDAHDSFHDGDAFQFGAVVSQGTAAAEKIVQQLARSQSRSLRILEPCRGGTAAAIVSRSYESSLQAVATEIVDIFNFTFQDGEFNILRFPRVILVDEFVVDKFIEKLEKASSGRPSGGNKNVSTGKLSVVRLQGIR
jgi:acyl-CoA reductase-like NAD-dependent aldehyde dehydrogenase